MNRFRQGNLDKRGLIIFCLCENVSMERIRESCKAYKMKLPFDKSFLLCGVSEVDVKLHNNNRLLILININILLSS